MERDILSDRADNIQDYRAARSDDDKGLKTLIKKLRDES